MKDKAQIESACERACDLWEKAQDNGTQYRSMTYEDGVRNALDWVLENVDEDPTKDE